MSLGPRAAVDQWLEVQVKCASCARRVDGAIGFAGLTLVDSRGFVVFDQGATCDACLGEGPSPN